MIADADRAQLRELIRGELTTLFRESLPASVTGRIIDGREVRASERFNLSSRTLVTLDDLKPATGAFLSIDANGFAVFSTVTGGSGATISIGTFAARPTAAALGSGNVYYATDTFQLARSNGAVYAEIGLEDIFQAKGDLVAGSAADTPIRLPVGTDGQCLLASSGAGSGLLWAGLGSITGSIVKAQTPLTTKGDLWVTDGTNMHRLAVSATDGQVLAASAAAADGLAYIALGSINGTLVMAQTVLTTKGDLLSVTAGALSRRAVSATDGQVLAAQSANADGIGYISLQTINGSLVKAQTPLTTKGDLWVTDGANMHRLAVSATDGQVVAAQAAAADGLAYIALGSINGSIVRAQTPLTTKGDILSTDGTTLHRIAVGTKAQALVADSVQTDGVKFGYPVAHYQQQQALNAATADGLPRCNMVRESIQNDVATSFAFGVMTVAAIWLEAGLVITRIGCINGATAGAGLTNRWAAIYTPGGAALGRQSTSVATATTTANTWLEFLLSATYTIPADGLYVVGVMFAGATTAPTARGGGLGNGIVSQPTGATGVSFPVVAGTAGSGLTTTAPAGPLTITAQGRQIAVWVY